MLIKSQKDFFSGVMFVAVGIAFAVGAKSYNVGEGARMGPGYFPLVLGVVLALLGAVVAFKAVVIPTDGGDPIGQWAWRPLSYIIAANLLFGILLGGLPSIDLPPMGLVAAIYVLTIVASKADGHFNLREVLILASVLAVGSYATFILLLKLQLPVWPAFITG
jgi:hypothetical protein